MSRFRRTAFVGVVASVASVTFAAAGAASMAAAASVPTFGYFATMVADPAHGHLYLGGDADSGQPGTVGGVQVTDVTGGQPTEITGVGDVDTMGLAPDAQTLYVWERSGAVRVIDTGTLTVTKSFDTQFTNCPTDLSVAAGKLWFTYGCSNDQALGSVDLTSGAVTTGLLAVTSNYHSHLSVVPGQPDELLMSGVNFNGDVARLDVSGDTPKILAQGSGGNVQQLTPLPDGSAVLVSDFTTTVRELRVSDLVDTGIAFHTPQSDSRFIRVSPDGTHVAVGTDFTDNSVSTFDADGSPIRTYSLGFSGSASSVENLRSFDWVGDSIAAVITDGYGKQITVRTFGNPLQADVSMTFEGPRTAVRGAKLTAHGTLAGLAGPLIGRNLTVVRRDMDGSHALPGAVTGPGGAFSIADVPPAGGAVVYVVSSPSDPAHQGATASIRVAVSRVNPAFSLTTNHTSYSYGQRQYVKVHLGTTYRSRTVSVLEREYGWSTWHVVRTARVDSHGYLSTSFVAHRNVSIVAKFGGDERYAPRSISLRRAVRAYIRTATAGSYGKSGRYLLFHASKVGALAVGVLPGKGGEAVNFRLQWLRSGKWRTVATDTEYLDDKGISAVVFRGRTGTPFRIRAEFPRDAANAAVVARWWYVEFR